MDLDRLDHVFERGHLWGLELDTKFRVLAATIEVDASQAPWKLASDHRVQLLCFPVSTVLGSLRRVGDDGSELVTFEVDQLVEVAAAFGGAALEAPLFGRPEPRPGEWGPRFSLEGRSTAPDGRSHTVTFGAVEPDARLDLFARFDDVELRDATGTSLSW